MPDHNQPSEILNQPGTKFFSVYPSFVATLETTQYLFTMLSTLHLSTWPNHLNLPLLMQFLKPSKPNHPLSSEEGFLSYKVTLSNHFIILISLCSNFNKWASFTAQVSLPYSIIDTSSTMSCLVHPTLQFEQREKFLEVRRGRRSLNFSILILFWKSHSLSKKNWFPLDLSYTVWVFHSTSNEP